MHTPIAFIIFNRPDLTARVFESIRKARPKKILIIADGPRTQKQGEAEACEKTRAIVESVDWPCEVLKNYSDVNLGCRQRVTSGLSWVFEQVEEAIILEDDCLPDPSFFPFCEELLNRYRNEPQVWSISGDNLQFLKKRTKDSYYFSQFPHIWGWATWRRVWKQYDAAISKWPEYSKSPEFRARFSSQAARDFWSTNFENIRHNRVDTWDYQFTFASFFANALHCIPSNNLISNIGFRNDATHTLSENTPLANLPVSAVTFPLQHPSNIEQNQKADHFVQTRLYSRSLWVRLIQKLGWI